MTEMHQAEKSVEFNASELESQVETRGAGAGPPFQLRFAPRRQLGRSYVSSVKPLGLPAIVKDKLYGGEQGAAPEGASRRVEELYRRGPREKYPLPLTTAHQYGWWWDQMFSESHISDRRLRHHIQDSSWMKEQLRVLTSDASYKRL